MTKRIVIFRDDGTEAEHLPHTIVTHRGIKRLVGVMRSKDKNFGVYNTIFEIRSISPLSIKINKSVFTLSRFRVIRFTEGDEVES